MEEQISQAIREQIKEDLLKELDKKFKEYGL